MAHEHLIGVRLARVGVRACLLRCLIGLRASLGCLDLPGSSLAGVLLRGLLKFQVAAAALDLARRSLGVALGAAQRGFGLVDRAPQRVAPLELGRLD